jgi:hypothetical protein
MNTIEINRHTYTIGTIKAKMLRKAVGITETLKDGNITTESLDSLVAFLCECYGDKFTIDEVYDGLEAKKLMSTIASTISYINGSVGES